MSRYQLYPHEYSGMTFTGSSDYTVLYSFSQITLPEASAIASIEVGVMNFMVLTIDGQAYTWSGAMGLDLTKIDLPSDFSADAGALGMFVTCLMGVDGTLRCWGPNYFGENGDGSAFGEQTYAPKSVVLIP